MEDLAANLSSMLLTVKCAFLLFAIAAFVAVLHVTRRCLAYKRQAAERKVPPSELLYLVADRERPEAEDWNSTI